MSFVCHAHAFALYQFRCPLYHYFLVLKDRHARKYSTLPPEFEEIVSYNHFRSSWYHYIDNLDIDVMKGFVCSNPQCLSCPQIVLCDATTLAYRHHFCESLQSLMNVDCHDQEELQCGR